MEAKELRIGNYIKYPLDANKNPVVVTGIIGTKIHTDAFEGDAECFFPISLTSEWLIKLGYISDEPILSDKPSFYRKGNHKIWCPFDRFLDEYYRFEIKYVHQLQNLYFTTQQEELKLEQS